jgi:cysteinyl-tRNA synthetase
VVAYIDIGQAEMYRAYWAKDWRAPRKRKTGNPDFLLAADPDGWDGSFQVAYWDTRWQEIWLGNDGLVARLASMGYDGIYLDWVDSYTDPTVVAAAKRAGLDPAEEMITFIERLGDAGRQVTSDFLVIPQNAVELIDSDPDRYTRAIDAVAFEDTWFYGQGGVSWNDSSAGDLRHQDEDADWTPANRLSLYRKYQERGLPVFTVDYCVKVENASLVYKEAATAGLRPLVTRVSLSRLTVTPPPASR